MSAYLDTCISELNGIGKTRAKQLGKMGVNTIKDLVYLFPRAYECRGDTKLLSTAPFDLPAPFILTVGTTVKTVKFRNRLTISKFKAFDDSGTVEVVFFNSPFIKDVFHIGDVFRFYGKLTFSKKTLQLQSPKYEQYDESKPLADIVPVYPLTEGISSKILNKIMLSVIDIAASELKDPLPEEIRLKHTLPTLSYAIRNLHFPSDEAALSSALRRMAFDEMLLFGLGIAISSRYKTKSGGIPFSPCSVQPLVQLLPYELTGDQKKTVNEIYKDTVRKNSEEDISPMARIVVGDVGSGKTICAVMAMYICVMSGYQAALMVPTEILARQHYDDISEMFGRLGIKTEILIGATPQKEKRRIHNGLSTGEIKVVIGTHALISERVEFENLGLVITDEQHRFGVAQRSRLKEKSKNAHLLVMSATPIPRTLALTMYGDLDVSRITEMPKGRMRVDTFVVDESYRARIYDFIKKQVALGGQCYIVCPSIEQKEEPYTVSFEPSSISSPFATSPYSDLKNVTDYTEELKTALPELRIETLHGKMKGEEKDSVMDLFQKGKVDVLVSTTVIEVGVNVPNASLMIVENADRFGLSQLHQLRGRVGRGQRKSYCILVSDSKSDSAKERLEIMRTTYDGYEIADKDLSMRGPGDFFLEKSSQNFRQSGGFTFKFAKLCDDHTLFEAAFSEAKRVITEDPELRRNENVALKMHLDLLFSADTSYIS